MVDSGGIKKAKDVIKKVIDSIRHKKYVDVLFGRGLMRHKMTRIQSKLHRIGTYVVCKLYLSCFANKHYILDDGVSSLADFIRIYQISWIYVEETKTKWGKYENLILIFYVF